MSNPTGEQQKINILINAEIFIENLFIVTRETFEGTWLSFKAALNQEDTFELDSVKYLFDQDTKPNLFTIVNFSNSSTTKKVNAGNNK